MAIALDATSGSGALAGGNPTWNHTCTGSNLILFVNACSIDGTEQITGVTYNSVAMTKIAYLASSGGDRGSSLWYLINPATGTHSIVVTNGGGSNAAGQAASYTGAKQSGVPDSSGSNSTSSATITASTTVVAANCWLVAGGTANSAISNSSGTLRTTSNSGGGGFIGDSNATVSTGSQSLTFSQSANFFSEIVASFAPAVATVNANFLAFM